MIRDEMISRLCFREEGLWLSGRDIPNRFVTVGGNASLYTDDELRLLVDFTDLQQANYHRRCGNSKLDWADNFISFYKDEVVAGQVVWGRKRCSWRNGSMSSPSLPEALGRFWGDLRNEDVVGDFVLFRSGEIAQVENAISYGDDQFHFGYHCLNDGRTGGSNRYAHDVVISAKSLPDLAQSMRMAIEHRIAASPNMDRDVAGSLATFCSNDDPKALTRMWTARVWWWLEYSSSENSCSVAAHEDAKTRWKAFA